MLEIENTSDANNYGRAGLASPPPLPPSEPRVGMGAEWVPSVPPAPLSRASDTSRCFAVTWLGRSWRGCSCSGAVGVWGSRFPLSQLAWLPPALWAALCRGMVPRRVLFQVMGCLWQGQCKPPPCACPEHRWSHGCVGGPHPMSLQAH